MPFYSTLQNDKLILLLHVHVPKTGGSSARKLFHDLGFVEHIGPDNQVMKTLSKRPAQHYEYEIYDHLFDIEKCTFSFTIVRNPYHRLLSSYYWQVFKEPSIRARQRYGETEEAEAFKRSKIKSFDEWVDTYFQAYQVQPYIMGNHLRPQQFYVGPKLNNVYKYEIGLEPIFADIFKLLGLTLDAPLSVPELNVSKNYIPEEYINPVASKKTIRDIIALYGHDFELFGYDPVDHPFT